MTEHSNGARLIAQYRGAIEPDPAQLAAIWKDVADPDAELRIVGHGRARPAPRSGLRLAVGAGIVALAAAAAVAWWIGSTTRHATAVADDTSSQAPYGSEPHERSQGAVRRTAAGAATHAQPRADSDAVASPDVFTTTVAPEPTPVAPRVSVPLRNRPRSAKLDPLAQEAALLRDAEALLRKGDSVGALGVLGEHAREFSKGALTVERTALRVIALCRQGKQAQGRGEAALLQRHEASKPYRERIRRACADE
jgi:hypothetical protein